MGFGAAVANADGDADPVITWISHSSGNWSTGSNWDAGRAPASGERVVIGVSENITVTVSSDASALSIHATNRLVLSGGTLTVGSTIQIDTADGLQLAGGTLQGGDVLAGSAGRAATVTGGATLDGVTLEGPVVVNDGAKLDVRSGLTLNGTLTLGSTGTSWAALLALNTQSWGGAGEVVFNTSPSPGTPGWLGVEDGATLTIGAGLTVRGGSVLLTNYRNSYGFSGTGSLVNRGTIRAEVSGQTITISFPSWINDLTGTLTTENGGLIATHGDWINLGTVATDGSVRVISGTVQNGSRAVTLGTPFSGAVLAVGRSYFEVQVPSAGFVSFSAAGPAGSNVELFVRRGEVPTTDSYDARVALPNSADQLLAVPNLQGGRWYVMVIVNGVPAPGPLTITANYGQDLLLSSASPDRHGNACAAAIEIYGAGFDASAVATLTNGSVTISAIDTEFLSPNRVVATFNLTGAAPGPWTLGLTQGGVTATLAFQISATIGGARLETSITAPAQIGFRSVATVWVEYENTGDATMPAPLLEVHGEQNGQIGAILTLDLTRLVQGFWTSAAPAGFSTSVQFLASGATPGLLHPGESRRVPIGYVGFVGGAANAPIHFRVQTS